MKRFAIRILLLTGALVVSTFQLFSYNFSGQVTDSETGKPLPYSFIKVTDKLYTQADANGKFRMTLPDTLLSGKARVLSPVHLSEYTTVSPDMPTDLEIKLKRKEVKKLAAFDSNKRYDIKVAGKKKAEGKKEKSILMGVNKSVGADSIFSKPSSIGISFRQLDYKPCFLKAVGLYIKNPEEMAECFKIRLNVYDIRKVKYKKTDIDIISELLEEPIMVEYNSSEVVDGKWVKDLPVAVPLSDDCLVEFQVLRDNNYDGKVYEFKYDSKKSLLLDPVIVRMNANPGQFILTGIDGELPFFYEYYREK